MGWSTLISSPTDDRGKVFPVIYTETPAQLTMDQLRAARAATHEVANRPGIHAFDDFVIDNRTG